MDIEENTDEIIFSLLNRKSNGKNIRRIFKIVRISVRVERHVLFVFSFFPHMWLEVSPRSFLVLCDWSVTFLSMDYHGFPFDSGPAGFPYRPS